MLEVVGRLIAAIDASGMKHTRIWPDAGPTKSNFSEIYNRKQVPTAVEYFNILRAVRRNCNLLTEGELVIGGANERATGGFAIVLAGAPSMAFGSSSWSRRLTAAFQWRTAVSTRLAARFSTFALTFAP